MFILHIQRSDYLIMDLLFNEQSSTLYHCLPTVYDISLVGYFFVLNNVNDNFD